MKRTTYSILCVIALGLLGYTVYYILSQKVAPPSVVVEVLPQVATTTPSVEDTSTYTTKFGKKIKLIETNPLGESLSTLTITTEGFATNSPIVLDVNKLTNSFYVDLNKDIYEELVITTIAQGSGSFGDVFIFTTASSTQLLPVTLPELTEDSTKKGALFEGYMGHDSFSVVEGKLTREFPTYAKTDTNNEPTGPRKSIVYSLTERNGVYIATFTRGTTTSPLPTNASTTKQDQ